MKLQFHENWEDDNHCLQASVMMVLNTLGKKISWEEVNRMSEYEEGHYSWTPISTIALSEKIPGTKLYSALDYNQFAERGEEYFREYNSANPQWFELQKKHASRGFKKEQAAARKLIAKQLSEKHEFSIKKIEKLLRDNLLIVIVDAGKLAHENWSSGHFVVVYDQDDKNFILHDPGLPPREAWTVNKEDFMDAFQKELIVIPRDGHK